MHRFSNLGTKVQSLFCSLMLFSVSLLVIPFLFMEPNYETASISFGKQTEKAMYASHVETNIVEVPVSGNILNVELNRFQIKTYHVWLK